MRNNPHTLLSVDNENPENRVENQGAGLKGVFVLRGGIILECP